MTELRLGGTDGGLVTVGGNGVARKTDRSGSQTGSQSIPSTLEHIPFALSKLYVDAAFNDVGTTAVTTKVLNASVAIPTGFLPKHTLDGRSNLDFATHRFNPRAFTPTMDLTVMLDHSTTAFPLDQAYTDALTLTGNWFRLEFNSGQTHNMHVDFFGKALRPAINHGSDDGQDVVQFTLALSDDGTNAPFTVRVETDSDAFQ